jgi:hypothetical protein
MIRVTIVWTDSYVEEIDAEDVRTDNPFLRLCLSDGREKIIPLSSIRYFSQGRKYNTNQNQGIDNTNQNQGGGIDNPGVMDFSN